jgi:RHS repeat-associated protein
MVDSTGTTDWTFNNASEVTEIDTPQGTTQYTYSSTTMRRATMVQVGTGTFTYGYDAAGRPTSVQNPNSETTSYAYDSVGRQQSITYSSGAYVGNGYDDRNRQLWANLRKADTTLLHAESWTYDDATNVLTHVNGGVTTTYGYDAANQLTSESRTGYSASYTYDANGNRLTKASGGVTENYSYDDADKLQDIKIGGVTQKSYGYDAAGRTTSVVTGAGTTTLAYDYEGRVTTITYPSTATNTFQYNGLSARTRKVDSAGTANYLRNGVTVTSPVLSDSSATYTPGVSERRSGTTTFEKPGIKNLGVQHSGAQAVQATQSYDAFGNPVGSTGTWNGAFGYGGKYGYQSDADSGLMLLGHRYYDSSTGRFLSRDPVKDGRNWYTYAENNPVKFADPEGYFIIVVAIVIVAFMLVGCGDSEEKRRRDDRWDQNKGYKPGENAAGNKKDAFDAHERTGQ